MKQNALGVFLFLLAVFSPLQICQASPNLGDYAEFTYQGWGYDGLVTDEIIDKNTQTDEVLLRSVLYIDGAAHPKQEWMKGSDLYSYETTQRSLEKCEQAGGQRGNFFITEMNISLESCKIDNVKARELLPSNTPWKKWRFRNSTSVWIGHAAIWRMLEADSDDGSVTKIKNFSFR